MLLSPANHNAVIHIVIVNYRCADFTAGCLSSLHDERSAGVQCRVTVVDSASGDRSVPVLQQMIEDNGWQSWVTLIASPRNDGFARGNNVGIATAARWPVRPRYTLLLNPDTRVRPGAIAALAEFLDRHPSVGIAGSRLEWESGDGQQAARRFPGVASELESTIRFGPVSRLLSSSIVAPPDPDQATETDWVVGAAMMIRQDVFDEIGQLDEGYFLYFEEVDFCLQARRAGWQVWYVPASRVVHYVGTSTGVTSSEKRGRCPVFWFESRRRYFLKNHGRVMLCAANLASIAGLSLHRFREVISRVPSRDHAGFLGDFIRFSLFGTAAGAER